MESNVAKLASVFMTGVQVQQSTKDAANNVTSNEKAVDFSQYMKTSVSNLAEQSQQSSEGVETTAVKKNDSQSFEEPLEKQQIVTQEALETKETSETKNTSQQQENSAEELENGHMIEEMLAGNNGKLGNKTEEIILFSEDLKQSLDTIKNELKQKIMDGFDITEEELEEALEVLAINIFDLLQTDQLKELAVYVSGEENLVSMITNGEMYAAYKETVACVEELSGMLTDKFSVAPEELEKVISQVKDMLVETEKLEGIIISPEDTVVSKVETASENVVLPKAEATQENVVLSENEILSENVVLSETETSSENVVASENMELSETETAPDVKATSETAILSKNLTSVKNSDETVVQSLDNEETDIISDTTKKDVDTPKGEIQDETWKAVTEIKETTEEVPKELKAENETTQPDNVETVNEETLTEMRNTNQEQSFSDTTEQNEAKEQDVLKENKETATVQTTITYSAIAGDKEVQTVVQTQRTDFEGIVKQIVEQIKVQIRPDVTSMELQLNPENLGKVNLHVSSKEGAVTAQLFVQNETVKTMVEGQLSILREAMAQQGVRVEAVEVAIETGSFERNLEQHSEQQKQEAEKQARSYQHKRINLLAGVDEETMNEAEILRTHIMRESGNSVDMDA
ncbi:MAG: flagellar hook-length control protein FliK [Lachnospiraceae bacterium]|nr:flagellar hook-length control protein FliK [Lachnospiraceae bacterium]